MATMAPKKGLAHGAGDREAPERPRPMDVLAQAEEDDSARGFLKARALIEQVRAQDVRIKLLRRDPRTGKWAYVNSIDADIFDEDYVLREYGPGSYKFSCFGAKGPDNPSGYLGGASFDVAEPAKKDAPNVPHGDGFGMKEMLLMMMQQNNALIAALASGSRGNGGGGASEIIAAAKQMSEMIASRTPVIDPVSMFKDAFGMGLKVARDAAESGEGEDFETKLLRGVAEPLAEVVRYATAQQQKGAVPPVAAPPTQEIHTLPKGSSVPSSNAPGWIKALHPYMPTFIGMAKAGTSARIVVDMIFDRVPDDVLDRIEGDCVAPNWIDETIAFLPVPFQTTYKEWVTAVLSELKAALLAPEDEGGDDGEGLPDGGDGAHDGEG